jgi:hypothetical protein
VTLESDLVAATVSWTSPAVARSYANTDDGRRRLASEVGVLGSHGYSPATSSGEGGHINIGRTFGTAVLTGGLSLLFGGSRTGGVIVVTFTRTPGSTTADKIADLLRRIAVLGYTPSYRGALGVEAQVDEVGTRGVITTTAWVHVTITNTRETPLDDVSVAVVLATHPQNIPGFQLGRWGIGQNNVWGPSHAGASITLWEEATGALARHEARQFTWEQVGVPSGARIAVVCLTKAVKTDGSWSDPDPVMLEEAAASNVARLEETERLADLVGTKQCPDCAERVRAEARICRFCRHEFWPDTGDPNAAAG